MKKHARRNKIGLLGPFSFGNLGNAALQQVLVQRFSKQFPETEFYGCCIDPQESMEVRQILPFPFDRHVAQPQVLARSAAIRATGNDSAKIHSQTRFASLLKDNLRAIWLKSREIQQELMFCAKALRFLKEFRLLVFGLGGLFDEVWGGKWGDLYSYFRWAVLGRFVGTPVVCLSVGVEEVHTRLGKLFCKTALVLAGYRSFRDPESKEKAKAMGVTGENWVFPDLAFGLEIEGSIVREAERARRDVVGVSPMPYCDPRFWPIRNPSVYQSYLTKLSSFVSWLLRNSYEVVLFPTQILMDRTAVEELNVAALRDLPSSLHTRLTKANLRTVNDCLVLLARLNMVVASRLHGVILSHLVGTSVLAVSPASKIDRLMEDMDLKDYVLNIEEFDLASLIARFKKLEANREIVRCEIKCKVAQYRKDVDAQFDLLFRTGGFLDLAQ